MKIVVAGNKQVKHVDCYTITLQELESVTTNFKFQSMMRGKTSFHLHHDL